MAKAPARLDEKLGPDDVAEVLEELLDAQNHAYVLGLKLNLKQRDVEAIQVKYKDPKDQLLHIIIAVLRRGETTWQNIIDALRSGVVDLPDLARKLQECHFPAPAIGSEDTSQSDNNNHDEGKDAVPKHSTCSTVCEVKAMVQKFRKRFKALKMSTVACLKKCGISVMMVIFTITSIKAVKEHKLFLKDNHKALCQSNDHMELFSFLNLYWNYLSYQLLEQLIEELNSDESAFNTVARDMSAYKSDLQEFMKKTKLAVFCEAEPQLLNEEPPAGFRRMVVEFDWSSTKSTLEDVDRFRRRYAQNYDIETCAMMLNSIVTGSFTVIWFVPASIVDQLMKGDKAITLFEEFRVKELRIRVQANFIVYQQEIKIRELLGTSECTVAAGGSKAKRSGAECKPEPSEEYPYVEQPSEDFICPVTKDLLLQPHLTSCCGNHLSKEAADRIQAEGWACPLCKAKSWSVMLNKHFQRVVFQLNVICPGKCDWVGSLAQFKKHSDSCAKIKDGHPLVTDLRRVSNDTEESPGTKQQTYLSAKKTTPHQEHRRAYGCFECPNCLQKWNSGNCWPYVGQQCLRCHTIVYPHTMRPLRPLRSIKHHSDHVCSMCVTLGYSCDKANIKQLP